ncbi:liprin-beta-1-like isoform X3 [Mytilus galloprovincialis]|uniref:liprin-beta-1-like isoform X3 n=2 Tax=Mytilus galloprovincialis TaxID=29158 RepID=UPI003F7C3349
MDSNSGIEASDMLAEALKQLDNVLANTKFEPPNGKAELSRRKTPRRHSHQARIVKLMEDLKNFLETCDEKSKVITMVPNEVTSYIRKWMIGGEENTSTGSLHGSAEERLRKTESEKDSLSLHVSVLTDQIDAQSEKIRDLEYSLAERHDKVINTEDMLQSELLTRTSLETHKLDLMAEISSLKIRLASADKDRRELDDRLRISQRQIKEHESKLAIKDAEINELRQRVVRNGTVVGSDSNEYEVEKLKKAVDALMLSNQEKDKRIDEMRKLVRKYKKIEEMVIHAQGRKALEEMMINAEDDTSSTSSTTPSLSDPTRDMFDDKNYSSPSATSTPVQSYDGNNLLVSTPKRSSGGLQRSNSAEDVTPTNKKKHIITNNNHPESYSSAGPESYGTLVKEDHTEVRRSRGFPALGRALMRVKSGKRSTSAPNLGDGITIIESAVDKSQTEVVTDDEDGLQHLSGIAGGMPIDAKKKSGLRRFLGKLKRSGSQDFHEREKTEQFKRGGVRATASGRLGWSKDTKVQDNTPFARWDSDRVTAWMNEIGLNMYLVECRKYIKNGDQMLKFTSHDLEKELGIKNYLHRKKLQLALQSISANSAEKFNFLDHNWVTRWLDDIGLPQYKDYFYDARIDGRMLHFLTIDDLVALKVTNELHHISIRRGIQILRAHSYNPQCLRRRPSPDEGHLQNIPGDVALWTNHRVMEWLRTIDLSEYAPNMRGSGVHGALMVLEPRFCAELFAQLLSIPSNKTLLRRHLNTHFIALIGNDTQHKKREHESNPAYIPLLPNAKVKVKKHGIFGHKRSKSDAEADDFLCPIDFGNGRMVNGRMDPEKDQKAAKEIGAFSKEINSLTNMLSSDKFLENVPSSNV